jgi:hypothetical protein
MRFVGPFVCALLVVACTTTESVMKSWVGRQESDLVSQWGAPNAAIDTRDGARILTWEQRWGQYGQNICRKSFTVNSSGTIERWSYQGCLF